MSNVLGLFMLIVIVLVVIVIIFGVTPLLENWIQREADRNGL